MSIIDRAAERAQIQLFRDVPIAGQRRGRDWAKLIGTARKLESEEWEAEKQMRNRIEGLSVKNVELLEKVDSLQRENYLLKLRDRMKQIDLSEQDQNRLLGEGGPQESAA